MSLIVVVVVRVLKRFGQVLLAVVATVDVVAGHSIVDIVVVVVVVVLQQFCIKKAK